MGRPSERKGYVYVLHFDQPICARGTCLHYIGCTCDLRQRLVTHAQGRGARLTQVAMERGIGWTLAAVGQTHVAGMRRIERQLKDWHGVSDQCSLCTEQPRAIPGTTGYPLEEMPFPVRSEKLATLGVKEPRVTVRLTTAEDTLRLVADIVWLMQQEKHALGFIPAGGEAGLTISVAAGRVAVCYVDGVLAGYCAFTEPLDKSCVKIHQCVVADSQRRCGIGSRLIGCITASRPTVPHVCKVREDLIANEFWTGIGFKLDGFETHDTSGARLNRYIWTPTVSINPQE